MFTKIKFNFLFIFTVLSSFLNLFSRNLAFGVETLNPIYPQNISGLTYDDAIDTSIVEAQVAIDYDERIYDDIYNDVKILWLIDMLKQDEATSTVTRAWERDLPPMVVTVNGAKAAQTTATTPLTIKLTNAFEKNNFHQYSTLAFSFSAGAGYTKYAYVVSKTVDGSAAALASDEISILPIQTPGGSELIGANSVDGIPDGTKIVVGAVSSSTGQRSFDPVSFHPEIHENYFQFHRTPYEITTHADKARLITNGGRLKTDANRIARIMHNQAIQNAFLTNGPKRYDKAKDGVVQYDKGYTQGVINWVLNNSPYNQLVTGEWTMKTIFDWSNLVFNSQLSDDYMIRHCVVNTAFSDLVWNAKMDKDFQLSKVPLNTYGIPGLSKISCNKGEFIFMVDRTFDLAYGNDPICLALTLDYIEYKEFMPTKLYTNIQENDKHTHKDEFATSFMFQYHGRKRHALLYSPSNGL